MSPHGAMGRRSGRVLACAVAFALPSGVLAQDLTAYGCDDGSRVEVVELPRDTLVLFYEDEPAVALTALPTAGFGRLFAADAWAWRILEDGTAELERSPAAQDTPLVTACSRAD